MLRKTVLLTCVLLIFPVGAPAAGEVPSRIDAVTLFANRALVTRTADVAVTQGVNDISIPLDAFYVDPDSLSATVFGDGEIQSVQLGERHLEDMPQEAIAGRERERDALGREKQCLEDHLTVVSHKEQFLLSLVSFADDQLPRDVATRFPETEDLAKTIAFLDTQFTALYTERESLKTRVGDLEKKIDVLDRELADLRGAARRSRPVIDIVFIAKRDQTITIEAQYISGQAAWRPLYTVFVPSLEDEARLMMSSQVYQKTGEDWSDVSLSLSTIPPLSGVQPPVPVPWNMDIPPARRMLMEKAAPVPQRDTARQSALGEEKKAEAAFAEAVTTELPLSFEYRPARRLTIPSRDKETVIPLFTKTISGRYFHVAVPRVRPRTFLVCEATADRELLPGILNVHFHGRFVGKTTLPEKRAGEDFRLNLGIDSAVAIKREKVKDRKKETFFGSVERDSIARELSYVITLENLKDHPVSVHVFDAVPVPRTDKITVKDIRFLPEPSVRDYEGREGVMLWIVENMTPKETQTITIEFVITYPRDVPIEGLP